MKYIKRTLETTIQKASGQFPVILVTGARQVGKTTLLKKLANKDREYITLDDPILRSLAEDDPAIFLQRFSGPVIIDEIQYAPDLLPHIKMMVDKDRLTGQFWLTGSQQFHLMKGVSESLAGRVAIINLCGLSQRELQGDSGASQFIPTDDRLKLRDKSPSLLLPELYQKIWLGGYPALYQENAPDRDLFYSSYVQTYLQRDVRDLANVGDIGAFTRFLRASAARTGQMLNMQDLCRDADINQATGKRWLSILEASGLVFLLEPFHSNINKRLIKTRKLYFIDTGLASWLTGWSSAETLEKGAMTGAFLETWVISEILKSILHNSSSSIGNLFYYRDKDGKEIDLLIQSNGTLYPVEIKKSASPNKEAVRHFKTLNNLKLPIGPGCIVSLAPQRIPITGNVQNVPVGML
ncbi:ATP-binding protein [bacterium]|nr:ATP-binding protein [bacterium]MBU1065971.1 ATP-binding protein [bacterium]MBU1635764.1 ATP-binding protein [bacterium]MBU1875433.1 ATP-binding protein [bacterium]